MILTHDPRNGASAPTSLHPTDPQEVHADFA